METPANERPSSRSRRKRGILIVIGSMAIVATAALILYWPSLRLPLIYDSLLHIRITKGLDFASVWLPTQDFGFYRPLTFLPLLIIKQLYGYYPAELLHAFNLFQHALNAALLGYLSWRLWHKLHWAIAAGLLFAFFPFSYQAIAVYGHNVHPATAGLLLLGLHTYLKGIRVGRQRRPGERFPVSWWFLTTIIFVLGLLSHESAVLFGAFASLVHWNDEGHLPTLQISDPVRSLRQLIRQPWIYYLAFGLLYFIAYQFLPLSRAPQASYSASALWYKLLYIVQAAVYPLAWLGQWLSQAETANVLIVFLSLAVVLGLTAWSASDKRNRLPLLMGWGWWILASLVIAIPLSASYLLHGPRLLYVSGIGLAILWPVFLQPLWHWPRGGRWLWYIVIALILVTSWLFVRDRLTSYAQLTDTVVVVEDVMADRPAEEGVLLINLPSWKAPTVNTYPIGVELVAMMGDYLFIEELINENLQSNRPAQVIKVPDLLANADYNYGIHEQTAGGYIEGDWAPAGSQLFVARHLGAGPEAYHLGAIMPPVKMASPLATMGPYELISAEAMYCENSVDLTTTWRIIPNTGTAGELSPTTSLFVQLIAENGSLISQADGPPLLLRPDLLELPGGWQIIDERELPVDGPQGGHILLGAYDYINSERLLAVDGSGQSLPDSALNISIGDCQ